jgi:hypothetical protein
MYLKGTIYLNCLALPVWQFRSEEGLQVLLKDSDGQGADDSIGYKHLKDSFFEKGLFTLFVSLFGGQRPLESFLLLVPPFFSDYSFLVHHPINRDDRQLLAHARVSDFTVACQFSQREQSLYVYVFTYIDRY